MKWVDGREYEGGLGPEFQELLHRIDERKAAEARRGLKCLALAPSLDLYRQLMAGEIVHVSLLNQDAVRKFGLRRGR